MRITITNDERNQLIVRHLDCVHAAANTFKVQPWMCDELISAGYEALVLASMRFDPKPRARPFPPSPTVSYLAPCTICWTTTNSGPPALFEDGVPPRRLFLIATRSTTKGVLLNTYRPAGPLTKV